MGVMETGQSIRRNVRGRRMRLRIITFHLAAVFVVLSPLVVVEALTRLCVPAPPVDPEDPYVSFTGLHPLFALNVAGTHFETAEERLAAFRRQSFAAVKGTRAFRIFCLGGSTVQGRPYSVETSFATWLQINLRAARPETNWEVINCGGISYASYRLVPILEELLQREPDLFIICTGHNEFLEEVSYGRLKRAPRVLIRLHRLLLNLRSYGLGDHWLFHRRLRHSRRTVLSVDVRTKLDMEKGLESYHRDTVRRRGTIEHFRRNLETMVRMCREARVPIILVNPVSNLKDCPPFKSEFQAGLPQEQTRRVIDLIEQARTLDWTDIYSKIGLLEQAVAIDNRYAGLLFQVGTCYERLGRFTEAKQWFLKAKEEDVCPLRMLEPMHDAVLDVAAGERVPLVDARSLIEERTPGGIPGQEWLLDHVHPNIEGHQLIADALYRTMEQIELVRAGGGWQTVRDELRRQHLSSLNEVYYLRGTRQLRRLQEWSRGRIPTE